MTYSEIEKLCLHIVEDDSIDKTKGNRKNSDMYHIYNGLCKTEGMIVGNMFATIMRTKYDVAIIID